MEGHNKEAEATMNSIAALHGGDTVSAYDQVARTYFELGIYEKAEHYCREAIQLRPDEGDLFRKLAWTCFAEHKFEIAKENLTKAFQLAKSEKKKKSLLRELRKMDEEIAKVQ